MMAIYTQSTAAKSGTLVNFTHTNVVCFTKSTGSEKLLVIVNMRNENSTYTIPSTLQSNDWINAFTQENIELETSLSLDPYQYYILQRTVN